MNLYGIMQNEISQSEKITMWFYLYKVSKVVKVIETENAVVAAKA